jgi:hypothetical protein
MVGKPQVSVFAPEVALSPSHSSRKRIFIWANSVAKCQIIERGMRPKRSVENCECSNDASKAIQPIQRSECEVANPAL